MKRTYFAVNEASGIQFYDVAPLRGCASLNL